MQPTKCEKNSQQKNYQSNFQNVTVQYVHSVYYQGLVPNDKHLDIRREMGKCFTVRFQIGRQEGNHPDFSFGKSVALASNKY